MKSNIVPASLSGSSRRSAFMILSAFLWVLCISSRAEALFCFSCIAIECHGDSSPAECEDARDFAVNNLRDLYYLPAYLPTCLPLNDTLQWRLLEQDDQLEPCLNDISNAATCSAGRMRIKTIGENEASPPRIRHATILGCASRKLLQALKEAVQENRCDMVKANGTLTKDSKIIHQLEIEHCSRIETVCHHTDFCVTHEQSVIKEFKDVNRSLARFDFGLVLGIVAFIIVIFAAVIGASLCSFPLNRPSNLPKSSTDDTDLVAVRSHTSEDAMRRKDLIDELRSLNK